LVIIVAINTVRRLAADIMHIGENRVRIKPESIKEAEAAMTRADVRKMIEKKLISKAEIKGRRKKERRHGKRGPGKRKGKHGKDAKNEWMAKIRSQRRFLKMLIESGALPKEHKRKVYLKIKAGFFKSKGTMLTHLKESNYVKKDYSVPTKKYEPKPIKKTAKHIKKAESERHGLQKAQTAHSSNKGLPKTVDEGDTSPAVQKGEKK